jgi:hypothetical protein
MKRRAFSQLLCVAVAMSASIVPAVARQKNWLASARRVRPETARDAALDAAIIEALYDGDTSAARRDKARYDYNRVDLNEDGQLETLVFLSAPAWCGSAGCVALVFQQAGGKYAPVTQISGVENPIIVSRKRTNGWHDLVAHVRWGEVGGRTLREYTAVLRYDGHTYPDQFPGAPPLGVRESVSGTAYFGTGQSHVRGLALAPVTRRVVKRKYEVRS